MYHAGQTPTLELQRLTAGRSAVVETTNKVGQLADSRTRHLEWQRHSDGSMVVSLDGEVLIQTTDRATQSAFDGFTFVNRGGDYSLRQIEILGTRQER